MACLTAAALQHTSEIKECYNSPYTKGDYCWLLRMMSKTSTTQTSIYTQFVALVHCGEHGLICH
jgi:hypothetical protein